MYEASIHILSKNTFKKDDFKYCSTHYVHNEMLGTQLNYLSTHTKKSYLYLELLDLHFRWFCI